MCVSLGEAIGFLPLFLLLQSFRRVLLSEVVPLVRVIAGELKIIDKKNRSGRYDLRNAPIYFS